MNEIEQKKKSSRIWLVLFVIAISYREVQILIDRGSWKKENYWIPLWYIKWTSKWKNFDSFHSIMGLAVLFLLEFAVAYLPKYYLGFLPDWINYQLWVIIYWAILYQLRNLLMHVVFKKKNKG